MIGRRIVLVAFLVSSFFLFERGTQARMSPREIYKNKAPGVVLIVAAPEGSSSASAGTGSIIRSDGTVITNCHVIYDEHRKAPFSTITVFLKPKKVTGNMSKDLTRHFPAKVLAFDKALDLALLKLQNPPGQLTVITMGDPDEIGPGDETVAIGHPEQGGLWTITTGVIGTQFEDFKGVNGKHVFQMETSLNRGNSGGPLFDVRGYQVGVNTAIARKGAGGVAITGVNFAVKSSVVKKWAGNHRVLISYGSENLSGNSEDRATVADAPKEKPHEKVYRDKESGGTIQVEEGYGEKDDPNEEVRRPFKKATKKRKPARFKKRYRIRPRPYSFRRLFTAADKVRGRAEEAFDDLEREIQRRRR